MIYSDNVILFSNRKEWTAWMTLKMFDEEKKCYLRCMILFVWNSIIGKINFWWEKKIKTVVASRGKYRDRMGRNKENLLGRWKYSLSWQSFGFHKYFYIYQSSSHCLLKIGKFTVCKFKLKILTLIKHMHS